MDDPHDDGRIDPRHSHTRRAVLRHMGGALAAVPLAGAASAAAFIDGLADRADGRGFVNPLAPKQPHFTPRAKSVIFLFMYGGPSQVDTFDYKPKLYELDGKTIQVKTRGRGGSKNEGRIVGPKWSFQQHGQCGHWVSELFPHLAKRVDDMTFVHSMYADSPIHGSAMFMMNSGHLFSGKPCLGSWVNYGLGSVNENLPGFVVMLDETGGPISGAKNWSSGYMPASYQGTVVKATGTPIMDLGLPPGMTRRRLRRLIDQMQRWNADHLARHDGNTDLAARIASYELAFKMMDHAPEALDLEGESEATKALYGLDEERTADFGRKCLLARRLVERGVRFVQIYSGGNHNDNNWDAHGDLKLNHDRHAGRTDKPIAGLLADLKRTGLLEETLVVWTGEFGRQPTAEYAKGTGRDHNSYGFTLWMAGGGLKPGISVGETDELGSSAVVDRCHVKHLHATILHQLGFDPNRLTYRFGGLDQRLVGVEGAEPIRQIIA
ncbi:MAG: DUF1501 domain-containing protein [Planctomycetota bacterium]|nr:MAG: DUF1501 domain-containing protein [Planctomycetota bacterium]